jgi:hypothetical protein
MSTANIKMTAALKAITLLRASGFPFAVCMPDGSKQGDLEVVPPKVKGTKFGNNVLFKHYGPYLDQLKAPGDAVVVPATDKYPATNLRAAIQSHANKTWGAGAVMLETSGDKSEVSVMLLIELPA